MPHQDAAIRAHIGMLSNGECHGIALSSHFKPRAYAHGRKTGETNANGCRVPELPPVPVTRHGCTQRVIGNYRRSRSRRRRQPQPLAAFHHGKENAQHRALQGRRAEGRKWGVPLAPFSREGEKLCCQIVMEHQLPWDSECDEYPDRKNCFSPRCRSKLRRRNQLHPRLQVSVKRRRLL